MIRAGDLKHRAELQKLAQVPDGSGGWKTDWIKERDIWCRIRPISGVQRMESMRAGSQISHEITTRYNEDVTQSKRIIYRGKAYALDAVWSPDEEREAMHCIAVEGKAT